MRRRAAFRAVLLLLLLGGCDMVVLSPSGDIAAQQRDLLLASTLLMLLIVVPVMGLTVFFAWRYSDEAQRALRSGLEPFDRPRAGDLGGAADDHHLPRRDHLDRARTCSTPSARSSGSASAGRCRRTSQPLEVQVVALDWKWLFIYPQYGIATRQRGRGAGRPAGPLPPDLAVGDERLLRAGARRDDLRHARHGVAAPRGDERRPATTRASPRNYSGAGFSGMRFRFHGLDAGRASTSGSPRPALDGEPLLDRAALPRARRSRARTSRRSSFGDVDPDLFRRIVNRCVEEGRLCIDQMMALDAPRRHRARRHAQHHARRGPPGERPRPRALLRRRVLHRRPSRSRSTAQDSRRPARPRRRRRPPRPTKPSDCGSDADGHRTLAHAARPASSSAA